MNPVKCSAGELFCPQPDTRFLVEYVRRDYAMLTRTARVNRHLKSHLASGASVRPENTLKYSVRNLGRNFVGFSLKLFCSRATTLPALYGYREVGHFLSGDTRVSLPSWAIPTALAAQAREYMQRFCSNEGVPPLWRTATARLQGPAQ